MFYLVVRNYIIIVATCNVCTSIVTQLPINKLTINSGHVEVKNDTYRCVQVTPKSDCHCVGRPYRIIV